MFEHYDVSTTQLPSNDVYDIALDSLRNSLWICCNNYIYLLDFSSGAISQLHYYTHTGEEMYNMHTILVDSHSRLVDRWQWSGGLLIWQNPQDTYECFYYRYKLDASEHAVSERITCIFEAQNGDIYLGSHG